MESVPGNLHAWLNSTLHWSRRLSNVSSVRFSGVSAAVLIIPANHRSCPRELWGSKIGFTKVQLLGKGLIDWLVCWLVIGWLIGWLIGWSVGWLVGWLLGWLDGSFLIDWMVRFWLIGWFVFGWCLLVASATVVDLRQEIDSPIKLLNRSQSIITWFPVSLDDDDDDSWRRNLRCRWSKGLWWWSYGLWFENHF